MNQAEHLAEISRLNTLVEEKDKEIERLKSLMPPAVRGQGYVGQGSWAVFAEQVVEERDRLRAAFSQVDEILARQRSNGVIGQDGQKGWSMFARQIVEERDRLRDAFSRVDDILASQRIKARVKGAKPYKLRGLPFRDTTGKDMVFSVNGFYTETHTEGLIEVPGVCLFRHSFHFEVVKPVLEWCWDFEDAQSVREQMSRDSRYSGLTIWTLTPPRSS